MFIYTGTDGKNIGIKNNILGWHPNVLGEDAIAAFADFDFASLGVSLAVFIKRHDNHRGAVLEAFLGSCNKSFFAFLKAY